MYIFDEFFASGKEESISPFLTKRSRHWGKNLSLKTAFLSAFLLSVAFIASFWSSDLSSLSLLFVYFLSGTPALLGMIEDIRNLEINIDTLMTLAALLAVVIGSPLEGALLLVLFELSGAMEEMVTKKTKQTVLSLHRLSPKFASVLNEDGSCFEKTVREIDIGTLLLIKAGEVVPLDGVVVSGNSFVNLVHLTGESEPIAKRPGDLMQAGAYNLDGALTMQVTRSSQDSTLSRIVNLILEAQESKPKLERFFARFGKWYAMLIISLCALFALFLPHIFHLSYLGEEGSIYRALAFLIAASPCALVIATPTAYLSAISSCARQGILLKGGAVLDALCQCQMVAFDKTGTLTTGKLDCTSFEHLSGPSSILPEEALSIAYSLEQNAVHPIGEAISLFAKAQGLTPFPLLSFQALPGYGLIGSAKGLQNQGDREVSIAIGHLGFIEEKLSEGQKKDLQALEDTWQKLGHNHALLLIGDDLFAFHFLDTIRPQSPSLIKKLKEEHRVIPLMLTGDHLGMAQAVAKEVGIDQIRANLRPEDKLLAVRSLSDDKGLIMIGDGINDAPALARATVGISLGKIGSATAIDASDVVFLNDDLMLLDSLLAKSKKTLQIIKQNITLALSVILFATTPALLGEIPLWLAVILHEGGTVLVGLNSLRLLSNRRNATL